MPGFDGTGPRGQGSMTGGGRGYCGMPADEVAARPVGRGAYGGRGGGKGRRNCFYAARFPGMRAQRGMPAFGGFGRIVSKEENLNTLKNQADLLKQQLEDTQARIQAMTSRQGSDKK